MEKDSMRQPVSRRGLLTFFVVLVPVIVLAEWYLQYPPPEGSIALPDLHTVYFADTARGWIGGDSSALYVTQDRGAHWNLVETTPGWNFRKIFFTGADTGWIAGLQDTVLHTTDCGATWDIFTSGNHPGHRGFCDIFFLSSGRGWGVGGAQGYYRKIMTTRNHGMQWEFQESYVTYRVNAIHFADSMNGWIAGGNITMAGFPDNSPLVRTTTSGGTVWDTKLPQPSLGGRGELHDICFIDRSTGWAVGDSGMVLRTTDRGVSWEHLTTGLEKSLYSVFCRDTTTIWITGDSGLLLYSPDRGDQWVLDSTGTQKNIREAFFIDSAHGWLVGDSGTILSNHCAGESRASGNRSPARNPGLSIHACTPAGGRSFMLHGSTTGGGTVSYEIFTPAGRLICGQECAVDCAGNFSAEIKGPARTGTGLCPGTYYCRCILYTPDYCCDTVLLFVVDGS
ncbi:MAG: hypothetical protein GF350_06190 [Chitinivibrionales bacterium]|nr:hypothetical protein [Chitinivibrionales bacterium]